MGWTLLYPLVVMSRKDTIVLRKSENFLVYAFVEGLGTAFLEIGAPTTAYQERVACKNAALIVQNVRHASVGVPRSGQSVNGVTSKAYLIALLQVKVGLSAASLRDHGRAAWKKLLQPSGAGNMIGMEVRIHCGRC